MRFASLWALSAIMIMHIAAGFAQADVVIDHRSRPISRPEANWRNYKLEKIALEVDIDGPKASCTLRYVIYNPGDRPIEVDFLAPLPQGGTVTGLNLFDGKNEMAGNIYGKDEAWKIYREIVSRLKDPALLEYAGRDTFRARIFPVPPKGRQTLDLRFDFLLPKDDGQTALNFPLAGPLTGGQKVDQDIHVTIRNVPNLSGLYSPLEGVKMEHKSGRETVVSFSSAKSTVLDKFQLYYQSESGPMGGLVLSHKPDKDDDGFFIFLADPDLDQGESPQVAKNVIFVLDKSGSMSGPKFRQAKEALRFILERLDDKDSFNLVDYNAKIYSWQPELMDMSAENRRSAQAYVDNLRSGGNTNIEGALASAFEMLKHTDDPSYIIFLTDGQPTTGETNELRLAEAARNFNPKEAARLFAFGVGHDVNARLLDRLSGQAGGSSVFVNPDENLEAKVSSFFSRISTPALTRPKLGADQPLNRVIPEELPDLFIGQQMVVTGRYPKGGPAVLTLKGRQGDKELKCEYKVNLAEGPSPDGYFIAALWAQRRIGELIDEIDMAGGQPSPELVRELVGLSKKYGILTPYTSFLALEEQAITRVAELEPRAARNLSIMEDTVGAGANRQRALKGQMMQSPVVAAPSSMPEAAGAYAMDMASLDKEVAQAENKNLSLPAQWAGQSFFLKNGRWQAENLTEDDLKNLVTVKQLSEEYFDLARKLKAEEMIWLSRPEPVIFKHEGVNYLIEPAA